MTAAIPPTLTRLAHACAERLFARRETVGVSESSSGGLVSAALLAVPGASAFFYGASITYARQAARAFMAVERLPPGMRSATEPYARFMAARVSERLGAVWGIAETGAAGPATNRFGDPTGHTCVAVAGPVSLSRTLNTGVSEREPNMALFAEATLQLFLEALEQA
ncbi:CinA family protein [Camelimonas abortus]|uniref:CinA family protein n=1 Tax=Camelimonas abortus TaxID=1017184 RepID=A0ABV7LB36_9HYPH